MLRYKKATWILMLFFQVSLLFYSTFCWINFAAGMKANCSGYSGWSLIGRYMGALWRLPRFHGDLISRGEVLVSLGGGGGPFLLDSSFLLEAEYHGIARGNGEFLVAGRLGWYLCDLGICWNVEKLQILLVNGQFSIAGRFRGYFRDLGNSRALVEFGETINILNSKKKKSAIFYRFWLSMRDTSWRLWTLYRIFSYESRLFRICNGEEVAMLLRWCHEALVNIGMHELTLNPEFRFLG